MSAHLLHTNLMYLYISMYLFHMLDKKKNHWNTIATWGVQRLQTHSWNLCEGGRGPTVLPSGVLKAVFFAQTEERTA